MTAFKIVDSGTRVALESALWHCAHNEMEGESAGLASSLYDCGYDVAQGQDIADHTKEVDLSLEVLTTLRGGIEQVRQAEIGASVDLIAGDEMLQQALGSVVYAIEEYPGFWQRSPDERVWMLEVRDAATRIKAGIDERVEDLTAVLA